MSDPKAVLAEHGIDVPANIDVNVVENSDNTVHITMPAAPAGAADLTDEELGNVAGGECTPHCSAGCAKMPDNIDAATPTWMWPGYH